MKGSDHIYLKTAHAIERQIRMGVYAIGDKLPSLRSTAIHYKVSMSTALGAYDELEKRGIIEPKPQSGYYVTSRQQFLNKEPSTSNPTKVKLRSEKSSIFTTVFNNNGLKGINLASTQLSPLLLPIPQLNKEVVVATRNLPYSGVIYDRYGNEKLRRQVALRSIKWGGNLKPSDIIPTSGCFDAIILCLTSLCKTGDTIGVESPVHFGVINAARNLGLKVLELPTNPATGIELEALEKILEKKKINILVMMGNYSNPFGSMMPDEHKKEIVRMLYQYNIPMIEDDIYSDLHYQSQYPAFCKTFDESGMVMWCGSASKTLAGGYRVGWLEAGKFKDRIMNSKPYHAVNCNTITHEAIANFFENNRYDNYLQKIRQTLYFNFLNFQNSIIRYFPEDTKITNPKGGFLLWVELNKKTDTMELYNKAIASKIMISPGGMFSLHDQYNNCFSLSFGMPWDLKIDKALKVLGTLSR